jgi:hypothetical protein
MAKKLKITKLKKRGVDLSVKTFTGEKGTYVVFRTPDGAYHAFVEIEAKEAALDLGEPKRHTNKMWDSIWNRKSSS